MNKVVARKKDGSMIKGYTGDFLPFKDIFHIHNDESDLATTIEVPVNDLKAIFFVKSLEGNRESHFAKKEKKVVPYSIGKKIRIIFKDNEIIEGYSHSLHLDRLGFFMTPSNPDDNNERIFAVLSFIKNIYIDNRAIDLTSITYSGKSCMVCGNRLESSWNFCPFDGTKIK